MTDDGWHGHIAGILIYPARLSKEQIRIQNEKLEKEWGLNIRDIKTKEPIYVEQPRRSMKQIIEEGARKLRASRLGLSDDNPKREPSCLTLVQK